MKERGEGAETGLKVAVFDGVAEMEVLKVREGPQQAKEGVQRVRFALVDPVVAALFEVLPSEVGLEINQIISVVLYKGEKDRVSGVSATVAERTADPVVLPAPALEWGGSFRILSFTRKIVPSVPPSPKMIIRAGDLVLRDSSRPESDGDAPDHRDEFRPLIQDLHESQRHVSAPVHDEVGEPDVHRARVPVPRDERVAGERFGASGGVPGEGVLERRLVDDVGDDLGREEEGTATEGEVDRGRGKLLVASAEERGREESSWKGTRSLHWERAEVGEETRCGETSISREGQERGQEARGPRLGVAPLPLPVSE